MPRYTYVCETCGACVDLFSPMDARNDPKQEAHLRPDNGHACDGALRRDPAVVVEITANTPYAWKP